MAIDPATAVEKLAALKERHRVVAREHARRKREQKRRSVDVNQPVDINPPRPRQIKVRRPGVVPEGPDEISWALWQDLGCSVERLKEFLRQREAASAPRECSPPTC